MPKLKQHKTFFDLLLTNFEKIEFEQRMERVAEKKYSLSTLKTLTPKILDEQEILAIEAIILTIVKV